MKTRSKIAALAASGVLALATANSAHAGPFEGDVDNRLPSQYVVKVATFGDGNPWWCPTWNGAGGYSCTHYWLPSGKSDDEIHGGSAWDADGFTVETHNYIYRTWFSSRTVSAGTYTRISSSEHVYCDLEFVGGAVTPVCHN